MNKFAVRLTNSQFELARKFERAGLCSISQAVKAFERGETEKINEWKKQLTERESAK